MYLAIDDVFNVADKFFLDNSPEDKLFYIWAHTYEFDYIDKMLWDRFEEFCKYVSGKQNVFYGTNKEVLLNK